MAGPNKLQIKKPRKNQSPRLADVETPDQILVDLAYPDDGRQVTARMRRTFKAFLGALRPAPGHKNNTRVSSVYLTTDSLKPLFEARSYFIAAGSLRAEDGMSRLLRLLVMDHSRLVNLWKTGELAFRSRMGDGTIVVAPGPAIPGTRFTVKEIDEPGFEDDLEDD